MAIIWQSSWFWVMLSAILLIMLGSVVLKMRTPQMQTETNYVAVPSATVFSTYMPPDIIQPFQNPYQLSLDQLDIRTQMIYDNIVISIPSCYDLASGEYSCIGQVSNNGNSDIGDTSINLSFFDDSGRKITHNNVTIDQRLIRSGTSASYRALFYPTDDTDFTEVTHVERSIDRVFAPSPNIRALNVINTDASFTENGRYNVTVSIENNSGHLAQNIRLFTTLENTEWGIVGYDVHEVEQDMQNGVIRNIAIEIIPHMLAEDIEASFHAEAIIRN